MPRTRNILIRALLSFIKEKAGQWCSEAGSQSGQGCQAMHHPDLESFQDRAWWEPGLLNGVTPVSLPSETAGSNELIISPTPRNAQFTSISEVNSVRVFTFRTNYEVLVQAYDSSLVCCLIFLPPSLSLNSFLRGNRASAVMGDFMEFCYYPIRLEMVIQNFVSGT